MLMEKEALKKSSLADELVVDVRLGGAPRCDCLQFLPSIGLFLPPCFFCSGIT